MLLSPPQLPPFSHSFSLFQENWPLLFLQRANHAPTPGPLHFLLALPGMLYSKYLCGSLNSFRSVLKFTFLERLLLTVPCHSQFPYPALLSSLSSITTDFLWTFLFPYYRRRREQILEVNQQSNHRHYSMETEVLLSENHGKHPNQCSTLEARTMLMVLWVCSFLWNTLIIKLIKGTT